MKMKPTILASVVEDSIADNGVRLITVQVRYPRIVHSELMTHRALSKNAGSSRAKPIAAMLKQIWNEPACPVEWGAAQPGMQAHTQLAGWRLRGVKALWKSSAMFAAAHSWAMMKLGAAKQIANRVTEPYQYIDVLITATDWDNFDMLRCHPDADPTMRDLAIEIMTAIELSVPKLLKMGEWHLPYVLTEERRTLPLQDQIKLSVARCARISYTPFDGNPSVEKERERYGKLVGSQPIHASPAEHQATPYFSAEMRTSNLRGWQQHRRDVEMRLKLFKSPRMRRTFTEDEMNNFMNKKLSSRQKDGLRRQLEVKSREDRIEMSFKEDI